MTSITPVRAELPLSSSNLSGFFGRGSSAVVRVLQAVASCFLWARDYAVGVSYTLKAVCLYNDNLESAICAIPVTKRRAVIHCANELVGSGGVWTLKSWVIVSVIRAVDQIPDSERKEVVRFAQRLRDAGGRIGSEDLASVIDTILRIDPREREEVIAVAEKCAAGGMLWKEVPWSNRSMQRQSLRRIVEALTDFSPAFREDIIRRQLPGFFLPQMSLGDKADIVRSMKTIYSLQSEEFQGEVIKSALDLVDFLGRARTKECEIWEEVFPIIPLLARKPLEAEAIVHWAKTLFDQDLGPKHSKGRTRVSIVRCLVDMPEQEREEIVGYAHRMITHEFTDYQRAAILHEIMQIPQAGREEVMFRVFIINHYDLRGNGPEGYADRMPMTIAHVRRGAGHYVYSWESR